MGNLFENNNRLNKMGEKKAQWQLAVDVSTKPNNNWIKNKQMNLLEWPSKNLALKQFVNELHTVTPMNVVIIWLSIVDFDGFCLFIFKKGCTHDKNSCNNLYRNHHRVWTLSCMSSCLIETSLKDHSMQITLIYSIFHSYLSLCIKIFFLARLLYYTILV